MSSNSFLQGKTLDENWFKYVLLGAPGKRDDLAEIVELQLNCAQ